MYGCTKHNGITSSGSCGQCGLEYCDDCLVFPFGPSRPPMCVSCALAFAGVRHKGAKVRAPKQKVSWAERRRRKNRPTVPTVSVPEPSLDAGFDLGSFESIAEIGPAEEFVDDDVVLDDVVLDDVVLDEVVLGDSLLPIERSAPLIAGPSIAEGLEALIAVPLPKRSVAVIPQ